ncbi:MAG TPA: enoyl-CoA hydratase-related protein [Actinomycetes bacterium]|jgi:enoyl-CoA hydratase|nr:enoyl-CoA hydratase-related protein [Actinomycetes bacterium]
MTDPPIEQRLAASGLAAAPGGERVALADFGTWAVVTLQKPDQLNALDHAAWLRLGGLLHDLRSRTDLRLVVLRGAGDRAFAAGADISEFPQERLSVQAALRYNEAVATAIRRLMTLPVPVIAMVNGLAVGGGCELAAACDVRVAAAHSRFGIPVGRLGVMLGPLEAYAVARVIGTARLKWLLFSGALISAEHALSIGLIDQVVASHDLPRQVASLVKNILDSSATTMRAAKQVSSIVSRGPTLDDFDLVTRLSVETYDGPDLKRGVASFLERTTPEPGEG